MAKRTPVASNPRTVQEVRRRYYAALNQGLDRDAAVNLAQSGQPLPEAVKQPSPVEPVPAAPTVQPLVHAAAPIVRKRPKALKVSPAVPPGPIAPQYPADAPPHVEPTVVRRTVVAPPVPKVVTTVKAPEVLATIEPPEVASYTEDMEPIVEPVAVLKETVKVVPDDLTQIHGIGGGTVKRLNDHGIISLAQIASWSPDEAQRIDDSLGLHGRVAREDWVGQAKALTKGGVR